MSISGHEREHLKLSKTVIYPILILILLSLISTSIFGTAQSTSRGSYSRATHPSDDTNASQWLDIVVDVTFEQPDWLFFYINYKVHEIYLPSYDEDTADAIRVKYQYERKTVETNPPILIALNQKIDGVTREIVNRTFPSNNQIYYAPAHVVSSFYGNPDENPYEPPLIFEQECRIKLNSSVYFTADELAEYEIKDLADLIDGVLKMGAKVTLDTKLYAGAGYKMEYIFRVEKYEEWTDEYQDQLTITHPKSNVKPKAQDRVEFSVNNLNGLYSSVMPIDNLVLRSKEPNRPDEESISYDFNIEMNEFNELWINKSNITINSLSLTNSIMTLPENISNLNFISSDGIRLFYYNGLLDLFDLDRGLMSEFNRLENQFTLTFNTTTPVILTNNWDISTITGLEPLYHLHDTSSLKRMGSERAIIGQISTSENIESSIFGNVSSSALKGLLNAGASAKLDLYINIPHSYTQRITIPKGFLFKDKTPITGTGTGASGFSYLLTPKQSKYLELNAEDPVQYHSSKANITIEIDIHEVEILGLNNYEASVKIDADGTLYHLKNEPASEVNKALPKGVTLDYYNSDILRLMYTEGMLDLEEIEDSVYSMIEENISKMLEKDVVMRVNFNEELLMFDGDTSRMDDLDPVTFSIRSRGKMQITEERTVRMGGFVTKQLELPLLGVRYWNVSYRLLLPNHIHVIGTPNVENSTTEYHGPFITRTADDRDELIVTIYGDPQYAYSGDELEVNVNVDIDITLWFFLSKIIIPIILFLILCFIISVLYLHRRYITKKIERLRKDPDMIVEEEEDDYSWDKAEKRKRTRERKNKYISTVVDKGKPEDYSERLDELRPARAMGREPKDKKGKKGKRRRGKGRKRREPQGLDPHSRKVSQMGRR